MRGKAKEGHAEVKACGAGATDVCVSCWPVQPHAFSVHDCVCLDTQGGARLLWATLLAVALAALGGWLAYWLSREYYTIAPYHYDSASYRFRAYEVYLAVQRSGRLAVALNTLSYKDSLDLTLRVLFAPQLLTLAHGHLPVLLAFMALFLLLETGILGVFVSLDLLLFFLFWEIGLVPMYFLINQWGGEKRSYASLKFILFTMGGSLGLLLAIQMIGVVTGTFDFVEILKAWPALQSGSLFGLPIATVKAIAFWAFVIAFAIKVPV